MRRGITQEQVDRAADALVVAGDKPTVEKIRAHLGTGSPNTIVRMLEVWRQGLAERLQEALSLPGVPADVGQAMAEIWRLAVDHATRIAQAQLAQEREALEQARDRFAQLESELAEQLQQANAAGQRLAAERNAAVQRTADLEARLGDVQQEKEEQRTQRDRLQQQADQLASEVERLNAALTSMQAASKAERDRYDAHLKSVEDHAQMEIDRARQDSKALRAEVAAVKRLHAQALAAIERDRRTLQRALHTAESDAARQAGHAAALEKALAQLRLVPANVRDARAPRQQARNPRKSMRTSST